MAGDLRFIQRLVDAETVSSSGHRYSGPDSHETHTGLQRGSPHNVEARHDGARSLRILYLTRRAWPAIGGIETLVRDVARGVGRAHEVELMALRIDNEPMSPVSDGPRLAPPFEPFTDGPVTVSPLCMSRRQRIALSPLLLQQVPLVRRYTAGRARHGFAWLYARVVAPQLAAAAARAEVMHIWSDGFPAAAGLLAARRAGLPVIITPFIHRGEWGDDKASLATYRQADRVAALVRPGAEDYVALGVAPERVVVSGACSPGVGVADGEALRRRHGIDGPLVLFLGHRGEHKGHRILLEAAVRVPGRDGTTFAFVGPGPPLSALAFQEGTRILDIGEVDDGQRAEWLHAANLLCLPSASESFGVVVLESWSAGTPVLTSDIPVLRSLVGESGGGLTVARNADAIADALRSLLADPVSLVAMGAAGHRHWQDNYSVERVSDWHVSLYEEVRREHGARRASRETPQRRHA